MTVWTVPATITRVIDGDTLQAELDLGWKITYHAKIRLAGVNCPELSNTAGPPARSFTLAWLFAAMPPTGDLERVRALAAPVTVRSHSLDKYGRVLGEVFRLPPGTPKGLIPPVDSMDRLSEALLVTGHAVAA